MRKLTFDRNGVENRKGEMPLYKTRRTVKGGDSVEQLNLLLSEMLVRKARKNEPEEPTETPNQTADAIGRTYSLS